MKAVWNDKRQLFLIELDANEAEAISSLVLSGVGIARTSRMPEMAARGRSFLTVVNQAHSKRTLRDSFFYRLAQKLFARSDLA